MAKELVVCVAFLILLTVTIASSEITTSTPNLCETQSKTWTGDCNNSHKCDKQCRKWEGEQHGACHLHEAKNICFCYSDCSSKGKKPSPPKKLCETQSKTWFGECKDSNKCDKQCIQWEGEEHGACHLHEAKPLCFCYSDCNSKGKKLSPPQKPSPPPGVGKPPPSGSRQPTPPEDSQPAPPDGGQPTPPGSGEPSPPDGGQPAPPDGGIPTPPSGCQTMDVDKLIAKALIRYKAQLIEKAPHL